MISKKSRKVVAALLIGATVCASGTFAYFNSTVDMNGLTQEGVQKALNITNGHITVTGKIDGTESVNYMWTYDVARLSTDADTVALYKSADGNTTAKDVYDNIYVNANRSPDIGGFADGTDVEVNGYNRMDVGSKLTGTITAARPGDAIVLGDASTISSAENINSPGLQITNDTNLTCKARVRFAQTADAKKQLQGMANAGWVMYINGQKITLSETLITDGKTTEITDNEITALNTELAKIATSIQGKNAGTAKTGTLSIRFELPLQTANKYQSLNTASGGNEAFDLTKLLDIVVTQENNPGYNVDGTDTHPSYDNVNVNKPTTGVTP